MTELLNNSNLLVRAVFRDSSVLVYSFAGLNSVFGSQFLKIYHDDDKYCSALLFGLFEKASQLALFTVADLGLANREGTRKFLLINMHFIH